MNNKHTLKKAAALFLGLALTVGATGCNFITTDNKKDLNQDVANVDISGKLDKEISAEVKGVLAYLSTTIKKRELVSYYLSTGYQYVEQYGYSYADTFNMLLDGLVSREIMIQYAVKYYLENDKDKSAAGCKKFIEDAIAATTDATVKKLLENHKEVLVFKYFLTEENYDKAIYGLKKSLNNSLDSMEESYVKESSEDEHNHEEARTLPTGVNTEKEDYYTNDYAVYTGRNQSTDCGEYETLDGSTRTSRQKAYNAFLTNLQAYDLIDGKEEDTHDVTKLNYYYVEMESVLGQALITQYFESLEDGVSANLNESYMQAKYAEALEKNEKDYANDDDAFAGALDSAAEGTYNLYGLEGYGYVYNILIPFSTSQNVKYSEAKSRGLSENELFAARRAIANDIVAKDLRDTWISEHDHANYSYVDGDKTYFFQDNLSENSKYEQLSHYAGKYAYTEETTDIAGFMEIFESYIEEITGLDASGMVNPTYATVTDFKGGDKKLDHEDYANFAYYAGQVTFTEEVKASDYFKKDSQQYKALSAVNELLFAYGTDPGAFNSYMGYKVSPSEGSTGFVKEFEYAAQQVVKQGVGSYAVCLTDYGWHILYCSFSYAGGEVYGGYNHSEKDVEGTFSNLYYETMKEAAFNNYANEEQTRVIREYDSDACVTRIEKAYKDLLEMDK